MPSMTRHDSSERGATLVEMAIILPLLLMLVFGIIELGMAFRTYLSVNNATRDASRVAALAGNDPDADCNTIVEAAKSLQISGELGNLDRIEIFIATQAGSQIAGKTNTYAYAAGDPLTCASWTAVVSWPSTNRQVLAGSTPLDIVGVRIVSTHDWITGLYPFSGSITIDESNITRVEPQAFE
jgi:Flp pilus assembly protein TadG